jgi:hypothetical protein
MPFVPHRPRRRFRPAIPGALLAASLAAAPALAAPPVPQACDQTDSGERLKCRFANIVAQQRATADMIVFMPEVPEIQKQGLMKQVERNDRAQGRTSPQNFKLLTKKPQVSCQVVEIVGDGMGDDDGICTGNENCAEVIGDGIGNDDGICRPRNGPNREVCVELCDEEAINSDPGNFDDDPVAGSLGRDLEEQLDDITAQYVEFNGMLEQEVQVRAAAQRLASNGDPCATVFAARVNTNVIAFLVGVAEGARMSADIAERLCDQSVFGTNTAAVCSIVEGIAGVARIVATALQFGDGAVDSDTIDATYACLQSLQVAVGGSNDALAGIQAQMSSFQQQINTVQQRLVGIEQLVNQVGGGVVQVQGQVEEVRVLVSTPLGQREGFTGSTSGSKSP